MKYSLYEVYSIRQAFSLYAVSQLHNRLIKKFNMSLQPCKPPYVYMNIKLKKNKNLHFTKTNSFLFR